jgi:hypothetical protein
MVVWVVVTVATAPEQLFLLLLPPLVLGWCLFLWVVVVNHCWSLVVRRCGALGRVEHQTNRWERKLVVVHSIQPRGC